jgi:superoxide reductase
MNRRELIRLGLYGGAASLVIPRAVIAEAATAPLQSTLAGGVYYTREAPGRWGKKVNSHMPEIEKQAGSDNKTDILVKTRHENDGYTHYIIKHVLLDSNFEFMQENMFDPTVTKWPESTFALEDYTGPLYAMSVCNKHDTWIDVIEI